MFHLNKRLFLGLGVMVASALSAACALPAPPPLPAAIVASATAISPAPTEPAEMPTESPTTSPTDMPATVTTVVITGTSISTASPFNVSVAQMFLDTAGFHGMAETLSDTRKIDTAYLSTVNRVTKVLTQTVWPAELNAEAQTFIGTLNTFAAALTAGDVEAAVESSDAVHDEQHELSEHIDEWTATGPAKAEAADPFDVSVAQMFLDTAGFHGMAETLSDTRKIDTAYLSTVNRVTKVLTQTVWPAALNAEAQTFIGTLGTFAAALTAGDVEAAVTSSDAVHDEQHELSEHINEWTATGPAKAETVDPFDVSVAQMFIDTAGFHGMAETLSNTRKIDTAYLTTVNRVTKVLTQTVWPAALNDEAQAFIGTLNTFGAALTAGDIEGAVELSEAVHDAQHDLSHHIDEWVEPDR